jgi:hypothetical protein
MIYIYIYMYYHSYEGSGEREWTWFHTLPDALSYVPLFSYQVSPLAVGSD